MGRNRCYGPGRVGAADELADKDLDQQLPEHRFSPRTPRGISSLGICPRAAVGRATGSLQDPCHGNPLFPPSAEDQDAVEDPLERRQVLPSEDAQHRAGFWFSLLL